MDGQARNCIGMSTSDLDLTSAWDAAENLNLSGLKCPMPAFLVERALRRIEPGCCLAITVTDALAPLDLRHLCQRDGHEVLDEVQKVDGAWRLLIRCGPRILMVIVGSDRQ